MLAAGQKLGPYLIDDSLGKGGMGEVYSAIDVRLNRHVALKILDTAFSRDEARGKRGSPPKRGPLQT
jgi:serine/threonine-protein kinase